MDEKNIEELGIDRLDTDEYDILVTDDSLIEYEDPDPDYETDSDGVTIIPPDIPIEEPDDNDHLENELPDDIPESELTIVDFSEGLGDEDQLDDFDILVTDESLIEYEDPDPTPPEDMTEVEEQVPEVVNDNIVTLPCIASVKAGDTVHVMVINGRPYVIGANGWGDQVDADISAANDLADEAKTSAETATAQASTAMTTAAQANQNAQNAVTAAGEVIGKANQALTESNEAKNAVADITADLNSVKTDASQTLGEAIDSLTEKKVEVMTADYATNDALKQQETTLNSEIERSAGKIQTTMQAEYARKTDLTQAKVDLQSQITQTAGKIGTSVSSIADAMADLQNGEVRAAIEAAKANLSTAASNLSEAKAALVTAQMESANAISNAALAQNQASDANATLAIAQNKLVDAQAYRDKLISYGASTEAIEEAEQAVVAAQNAVTAAQSAADIATANARAAQQEVETAAQVVVNTEADVETAQEAYDLAVEGLHQASYTGIEQTAEAITLRATKKELEDGYYTKTQMDAQLKIDGESITSVVTKTRDTVDNLEIGGRNYYRPSQTVELGCTGAASTASLISTGSCIGFYVPTSPGDIWSLSRSSKANNRFDYCFTVNEPANGVLIQGWRSIYREELKIEGIVVPEGVNYLFIYLSNQNDTIPNIKLERGNKVTDWTPAPDDIESVVEQLASSIASLVRGEDGSSLVMQDDNGLFYFDIEGLKSSAESSAANLAKLMEALGEVESKDGKTLVEKLDEMEDVLTGLGFKTEYVNVDVDENGNPMIVLGETDSDSKLLITNTRFVFMEGSNETTYIKDNTLVTNNVEVKDELRQGMWMRKSRPNGNLGLVWIGGAV